jgi:hypothetical protein
MRHLKDGSRAANCGDLEGKASTRHTNTGAIMKDYDNIGVRIPQLFLPREGIDLTKWSVIACDQHTSEPEYWEQVKEIIGDCPSTLHLILPEIYAGSSEEEKSAQHVHIRMQEYLSENVLVPYEGLFYIERKVGTRCRRGLLLCLDLEQYDFQQGSQSLIRASEGTMIERLHSRLRIREKAALELPHSLVLIDDPERTVIEPLAGRTGGTGAALVRRYDFDLMMDSGHLTGYQIVDPSVEANVLRALAGLADRQAFSRKYGVGEEQKVLLFAMGDGNHSLATAKIIWERIKLQVGMDHPARFALVEVVNVHDEGLAFEPIHRVLFNVKKDVLAALQEFYSSGFSFSPERNLGQLMDKVEASNNGRQVFGLISEEISGIVKIVNPVSNLAVGTLQAFLEAFLIEGGAEKIDYVHGGDVVSRLGCQHGNTGFYLRRMDKNDLFKTVILDGILPIKTFSMGEAKEKRFYMECRRITE